jgi:hypothetical protein
VGKAIQFIDMEFNLLQAFDVGTDLVNALFIGREDFGALVERL